MMPTETLRAMLDERGVEWKDYGYENHTWWGEWHAENRSSVNGLFLKVEGVVTPEQAVEATLGSCSCSNDCTNSERTNAACKPIAYDNGYSTDHLEPGEYHEFWEPACACGNCGELIPMRKVCPNCGRRLEVDA